MNRPTKPTTKTTDNLPRVSRGGCWYYLVVARVRAASRDGDAPSLRNDNLGFRCALRGREPLKVTP
jgi:formylglycine-generating enzyme required for sulfatase activity